MGPKPSKLSDEEKLRDLEYIVSGKKLLIKPATFALFSLNCLSAQNRLTKDITGYIMKLCYQLLSTQKYRMDLQSHGYMKKESKYSLADLLKPPNPIFSGTEIPHLQQNKVYLNISLGDRINEVFMEGRIKGIPGFSRNFHLDCAELLVAITRKIDGSDNSLDGKVEYVSEHLHDTDRGIELHTMRTLLFVYDNVYLRSRLR